MCIEERMYPDKLRYEFSHGVGMHEERYNWASNFCKDKVVLDAGCGCGYGSERLSKVAQKVVSVDISEEAIKYAKNRYAAKNIDYHVMDLRKLELDVKFDVIICFEIVEHIENYNKFMTIAKKMLKKGGLILASVPMFDIPGKNKWHKSCFIIEDIYNMFGVNDFKVDIIFQHAETTKIHDYNPIRMLGESLYIIKAEKGKKTESLFKWVAPYKYNISVVVPCYNTEEFIERALWTIIYQIRRPNEIIVVDDASTDNSMKIVEKMQKKYKYLNIKIVKHDKNKGIAETRNSGVKASTGDYITFLSADDEWEPNFISFMECSVLNYGDKIFYTSFSIINGIDQLVDTFNVPDIKDQDSFRIMIWDAVLRSNFFTNFSTIFAPARYFKELLFKHRFCEDSYWALMSCIIKKWEWIGFKIPLCRYRIHNGQVTNNKLNSIPEMNAEIMKEVVEARNESIASKR